MSKNSQFEKFINKTKGSVIKEKIKQEKKQEKKKRAEGIEKRFEEKRRMRMEGRVQGSGFKVQGREAGDKSREAGDKSREAGDKSREKGDKSREAGVKSREKGVQGSGFKVQRSEAGAGGREKGVQGSGFKVQRQEPGDKGREPEDKRSAFDTKSPVTEVEKGKSEDKTITGAKDRKITGANQDIKPGNPKTATKGSANPASRVSKNASPVQSDEVAGMPVNKYISHGGICSRRDAALLVKQGDVTVNGQVISDPGTRVSDTDLVKVKGNKITPSRNYQYILLNKPKDYITTLEDPQGRRTVLDLIRHATHERVYPVGRLDRNTSGLLLLTNDGDLAQTLAHPKHEIKKIYEVKLDKDLSKNDFDTLLNGIMLEDGFIAPDALAYADAKDRSIIGIEIHSGRNRIVRRIFEKLGYDVRGLDRVMYAGLTKKNIQRGKWRFLTEKEVRILKHFNKSAAKH